MANQKIVIHQVLKEPRNQEVWSRRAYVDWVNETLAANFTNTLEFRNGAAYIQLIDMLFPGVMPCDEVKFSAETEYDCYKNFRVLEQLFKKLGILKVFDTDALSSGRHVESWAFLKWFKAFFDHNYTKKVYDPLKARNYAYMGFGRKHANAASSGPSEKVQSTNNKNTTTCKVTKLHYKTSNSRKLTPIRSKSVVGLQSGCQPREEDAFKIKRKSFMSRKACRSVMCLLDRKHVSGTNSPVTMVEQENNTFLGEQEPLNECLEHEPEPSFKELEFISAVNLSFTERPISAMNLGFIEKPIETVAPNDTKACGECITEKDHELEEIMQNENFDDLLSHKKFGNVITETNTDINFELLLNNEKSIKNHVGSATELTGILERALLLKTEHDPNKNAEGKSEIQESNVRSFVVNTTQKYEDCGVRVTENVQLKIERSANEKENPNENVDKESQKKISLMIEKLLRYHYNERREYFQTIADYLKEENKKAQRQM